MSLSNIAREPRRELTESGVGIALAVFILATWFGLAWWLASFSSVAGAFPVSLVLILLGALILFLFLVLTHGIGEKVCDALERRGYHLRPKRAPVQVTYL